jgi:hypothetical protein
VILKHPVKLGEEHIISIRIIDGQASTGDLVVKDGEAMLSLKGVSIEFVESALPGFSAVRRGSEISDNLDPLAGLDDRVQHTEDILVLVLVIEVFISARGGRIGVVLQLALGRGQVLEHRVPMQVPTMARALVLACLEESSGVYVAQGTRGV